MMKTVDLLQLQAAIQPRDTVCIPELQKEYGLTYGEAVRLVGKMQRLGWLSAEAAGVDYTVMKAHLRLRRLRHSEAFALYEALTGDCIHVLLYLCEHRGAVFEELKDELSGGEDTQKAIGVLLSHRLIYEHEGCYHLCIRNKVVEALQTISRSRSRFRRIKRSEEASEREQIQKLFDELLDGDWED